MDRSKCEKTFPRIQPFFGDGQVIHGSLSCLDAVFNQREMVLSFQVIYVCNYFKNLNGVAPPSLRLQRCQSHFIESFFIMDRGATQQFGFGVGKGHGWINLKIIGTPIKVSISYFMIMGSLEVSSNKGNV